MAAIEWSEAAIQELAAIRESLPGTSDSAAAEWVRRVYDSVARLEAFPESGRVVPEVSSTSLREVIVGQYRVIYRHRAGAVLIIAIAHGSMDLFKTHTAGDLDD